MKKIFKFFWSHKILAVFCLAAVGLAGYYTIKHFEKPADENKYVLAAVEKGDLISAVSGSGQVVSLEELSVKSAVSGRVIYIGVKPGQEVKKGDLLFKIDTKTAQKDLETAQLNLDLAKAQLADFLAPTDKLKIWQAENTLEKARQAEEEAKENIILGYQAAFDSIRDLFFELPSITAFLKDVLYSEEIGKVENTCVGLWNSDCFYNSVLANHFNQRRDLEILINEARNDYQEAKKYYDIVFAEYRNLDRYASAEQIEKLLDKTIELLEEIAALIRAQMNMIDYWIDYRNSAGLKVFSKAEDYQTSLKNYTLKIDNYIFSLSNKKRVFVSNQQALANAQYTLEEKEQALEDLKKGPSELDIKTKELNVWQKEEALETAKENLINCYIYAPFSGVVASVGNKAKLNETVSSGTEMAVLVSRQQLAEISLNEVDIADIKVNQKATLSFDALDNLTLTGAVIEIDNIGSVSQGVVNYGVKILLDSQNEKVKPGMSLTANIITNIKQNVLLLPGSALKQISGAAYVETAVLQDNLNQTAANISGLSFAQDGLEIIRKEIQIGDSNDTMVEVVSGLNEGELVISQTIAAANAAATQTRTNTLPMGGTGAMQGIIRFNR